MQTLLVPICALLFVVANARVPHEKREVQLNDVERWPIEAEALLPMRIGLRSNQNAIANATQWIKDVSDPASVNYGKHWTQDMVIEAFKPSDETVVRVKEWLSSHGIAPTHTSNKMWLAFDMPASKAQEMLGTQYFEHYNPKGRFEVSCDEYYIPDYLKQHVDFVKPGLASSVVTGRTKRSRQWLATPNYQSVQEFFQESPSQNAHKNHTNHTLPPFPADDLKHCDIAVSPACIRTLYNFSVPDSNLSVSRNNSMGIFEEFSIARQKDLDLFWSYYTDIPSGVGPILKSIDGAIVSVQKARTLKNYTGVFGWDSALGEATADYEVAIPIIYPQTTTTFQTEDPHWAYYANLNYAPWYFTDFLDAIDGSYCRDSTLNITFRNGTYPTYPDRRPDGYKGQLECGVFRPTNVLSISYGLWEIPEEPIAYKDRQCTEYLKLGLQGTSVFFSSGDYGTAPCGKHMGGYGRVFTTLWPQGCPWVTVVGVTAIDRGALGTDPEISPGWSGGGFSLLYDRPWYQASTLDTYFDEHDPKHIPYFHGREWRNQTGRYNRDGRGFPDVSAVGRLINNVELGDWDRVGGSSLSTPIVAALFNRVVEERLRRGKGPLGLVNPVLYTNPHALNDIVVGNNSEFCQGFSCVPGWDPVTGLGTPNFPELLEVFLNLP